ncbi:unnamed protein product [Coregonus sp. 'balchen']|nr:unnamed protein product [Coregonus sp. 'balchen']
MLTYCVRRLIWRCENIPKTSLCCRIAFPLQHCRDRCTATSARSGAEDSDHTKTLMQLCTDRYYIASGQLHRDSFQRGSNCGYGPLGMELRKNILEQWWNSVIGSRAEVFGISTLHTSKDRTTERDGQLRVVDTENLRQILSQRELSKDQLIQKLQTLIQNGALEQYASSLELVNRKLPFGLAETGLCFQPSGGPVAGLLGTASAAVFALGPSDFSCSDITEEELAGRASRGVKIVYNFPWGPEALETLLSRGDAELLQTHKGARNKLQCRDGRKSVVPYAISVTGNIERGVLAYLYNSIQQVLKLHPILSPVKVALDMGRGATVELRQVCEGLLQEFLEGEVAAWPGYLETMPTSMEQLNTKYDEMGVLFTVVISDNTLESGLLQVRSRDTTIKETMHISEVKNFLVRYISAAENI